MSRCNNTRSLPVELYSRFPRCAGCLALAVAGTFTANALAQSTVVVTVENIAPPNGIFLTPTWIGFHNGTFDLFNPGSAVPAGGFMERLAEDGDVAPLRAAFAAAQPGAPDDVITGPGGINTPPVLDPGESNSAVFSTNGTVNRFMSFASMMVPSNDGFVANPNPLAIEVFDVAGNFLGPKTIIILGADIWDVGTELNNETDAAFINQTAPDTGVTTSDPVALHVGFNGSVGNPGGTPQNILGATNPQGAFFDPINADFTRPGYQFARITIVPEPSSALALAIGTSLGLLSRRRRSF